MGTLKVIKRQAEHCRVCREIKRLATTLKIKV
jgi:hypothetical protein